MAQRIYSIDLQDTVFPMLSEQQGRTIIGGTVGESPSRENKPGIAYCHNVMPNNYGFKSIGFVQGVQPITLPGGAIMIGQRPIQGDQQNRYVLGWDSLGQAYSLFSGGVSWTPVPHSFTVPPGFSMDDVTVGTVDGVSFIQIKNTATLNYNESTNVLDTITLTGIASPRGLIGSSGYLLAYTKSAIVWSSTIDPTDFTPSAVTGAGGGNLAERGGPITFGTRNSLGVLIYAETNIIAGTYTGNRAFPFKFREVTDSKGGEDLDLVAYDANSKQQFVYTRAGLQAVSSQTAETLLPFVTDFLQGRRFEDYNEATKLYEITTLSLPDAIIKKIRYVSSRYLVISYGLTSFTHALIFDTGLQKLGKVKIDHTDVIDIVRSQGVPAPEENIGFLQSTGRVQILDFSDISVEDKGVVILGKLQVSRTRFMDLLGVEVENVLVGDELEVDSQVSLDGKTFTVVEATLKDSATNIREYDFRSEAMSHSLVFTGKFNLVTVQITYRVGGRR